MCLFASGLIAGFADNWFVFNNVGARLKGSEMLKRLVGPNNLDKAIHSIDHNIGFWVGNVVLGFLLAFMGPLGTLFGLPIDTRHITLATSQFGAAVASLNFQVTLGYSLWIGASLFLMGMCNLGVSFSLSLFVAVRSRRIRFSQTPELLRLLLQRFLKHPVDFFLPLRDPP